jgi:hypothetical protein
MIQFYFMSILFNAAAGYLLVSERDSEVGAVETGFPRFLQNETLHLILGTLTVVTGFLKLLSPAEANIPVVGDLVPALAGIAAGFTLIVEFYRSHSTLDSDLSSTSFGSTDFTSVDFRSEEPSKNITGFLVKNRRAVGIVSIAAAVLHFFLVRVPLL